MLDISIRRGTIVDGSGEPRYHGDIGVVGGRIAQMGDLASARARRTIDAEGMVVCPGFIDMHAHSELHLLADPQHQMKVAQGVTLEVLGQDGLSYAPVSSAGMMDELRQQLRGWNGDPPGIAWNWRTVGEYLDQLGGGAAVNVAYLVPHGNLRIMAMGCEARQPSTSELTRMQKALAEGMEDGALGLSAGLTYVPGMYADREELVSLCRTVADLGGFFCPHHRNYGSHAIAAYAECIDIARASGVALHFPHANLNRECNRGRAAELLGMLDDALEEGVDLTLDSYPYTAGATTLHSMLPSWMQVGGPEDTMARLKDPGLHERIRVELEETGSDGAHGVPIDWSAVTIADVKAPADMPYVGRSIIEAADLAGQPPATFCFDLLVRNELGIACIVHAGNEENVRAIMRHRMHTVGSDGILVGGSPHPRGWGTLPRYLSRYVRDLGVLTLEECVRHMTSTPATRLGLADRGRLRPGMAADVVCFDPGRVADTATYAEPRQLPAGIHHVMVNGVPVIDSGHVTGALPGRVLRRLDR